MNLTPVGMEICILLLALFILFLDLLGVRNRKALARLTLLGMACTGLYGFNLCGKWQEAFSGAFLFDPVAFFFKEVFLLIAFVVVLLSIDFLEKTTPYVAEFYSLVLLIVVGMMGMASAAELLTLFISIELVSIPMYVLAAYLKNDSRSSEAGLKYFLLGAFSSGLLLYGISFVYGSLGTTYFRQIESRYMELFLQSGTFSHSLYLGVIMIIAGFAFKIASAPFHMWAPDVYEGAPTPVTAFISVGPKAAGIAVILRFFLASLGFSSIWALFFAVLSFLSMTVGNLGALHQTNFKRLLAYSGIAQIGYILLGLMSFSQFGAAASMFYIVVYALTNLGAFGVLLSCAQVTGSDQIEDFAGLNRRSPALALIMLLALLSLAGIPPLAGFVGKFYLFTAAYDAFEHRLVGLVLAAIIFSVISLFYYLGVLKVIYFRSPRSEEPIPTGCPMRVALSICTLGIVLLGFFPPLFPSAFQIANTLMGGG